MYRLPWDELKVFEEWLKQWPHLRFCKDPVLDRDVRSPGELIALVESMEERFKTTAQPARDYRALLVSDKLVKIQARKRKAKIEMTTGNKSYNRKSKKKSKVTSK